MSYPGYGAPPGGAPGYGAPPGGAPGYGAPPGGAPGYGAPPGGSPGYGAPPGGAPGYGAPPGGAPGYGAPPGGAPGYGAPPGGAPGYGAPPGGSPGYGGPPGAAPGYTAPPSSAGHHGASPATVSSGAPPSSQAQYGTQQVDPQIVGWFQAVDKDRSGHIDEHELSAALGMSGNHFSVECSKLMIKMFDKDHSGKIGLNEFQQLHQYILQMQAGFRHVDRDGSGHLNATEIQQALTTSGYHLTPQTFDALFKKFDRKKTGNLQLDGYVELCCFLGTARNVFGAWDQQRLGTVNFNFDQFIYASNSLHS